MPKIAIIHFNPIELYPPVQNLIFFIEKNHPDLKIFIFTTRPVKTVPPFDIISPRIKIARLGHTEYGSSSIKKLINYINFYFTCFIKICSITPDKILYFETISSFPAILYKRFIQPNTAVFIHYHEYTSPDEYRKGIIRWFHRLEKWIYPKADWVSQTNQDRMTHFIGDEFPVKINNPHILPNYPPAAWYRLPKDEVHLPVKIIYIGAVGLVSMYLKEFSEWIISNNGKVIWDIYTHNIDVKAKKYLNTLNSDFIALFNGVKYEQLPEILKNYDIGVILYNGIIPNHVFSVPNKFFEYLVCGLDVWFPDTIAGCLPFINEYGSPKVIALNFNNLEKLDLEKIVQRKKGGGNELTCFNENILITLTSQL